MPRGIRIILGAIEFIVEGCDEMRRDECSESFASAEQAYEANREYQKMRNRFSDTPSSSRSTAAATQSRGATRGRFSFAGRFRRPAHPGAPFSRRYSSLEYSEDASAEFDPTLGDAPEDIELRDVIQYHLDDDTVPMAERLALAMSAMGRAPSKHFFTKIDLRSGYHQIRVATEDQPKTAFRSRFGHYEFTVMPFGLTNAPATFQTAMNDIFRDILEEYVLVYLDDILVYNRTLKDHLRHLRDVLQRLRKHGFYAKLSKCRFAQRKVDFLGHHVSDKGLHVDDAKITAIAEWPVPTSAKQLRSFLGFTSYYSNFIQGYARYSYVLTSTLLRKNPPWSWTPLCEDAFRALKKAVTCAPVLRLPDFYRPFIVTTDALDFAVGAVLS
ncbi:hypothetical protein CBR_g44441 [Chara braunii]|uniref:Reverse transcriptase domain-containing protein n=1 Tax=Chara braunii TaxID=69332 RepID=A0A388LXF2_CHABU|nr:hypothetical protein CBR_g44441 [Chara braunii]|eukprot:GBG86986.1 hypothetical protein CBR_g44441 [Chara braunii]